MIKSFYSEHHLGLNIILFTLLHTHFHLIFDDFQCKLHQYTSPLILSYSSVFFFFKVKLT